MEKKSISTQTAVKGLINGFVAYGVLVIFLFIVLIILVSYCINKNINNIDYNVLKYSIPTLGAFLAFFLIRGICRLSTFDLFKKCKIEKDKIHQISSRMNLFFISLIIILTLSIILFLSTKFNNEKANIKQLSNDYYSEYSKDFADYLTLELVEEFQVKKTDTIIQTIIIEIGLLLGIFSLIPAQQKFIEDYNS